MLSILIPTYNYNCYPLVLELKKQADSLFIDYEILIQDDASTMHQDNNQKINKLSNCSYTVSPENYGRTKTRNDLAQKSSYDWLLFLDADVIPVHSDFIAKYITFYTTGYDIILGGLKYEDTTPHFSEILRHKYGQNREVKSALQRNSNPYQYICSGNFLIQKSVFLKTNFNKDQNLYGMDVFFSYQLYRHQSKILHIENPVYHLGLETNIIFFEKSLAAVINRKKLYAEFTEIEQISPLIKTAIKIKTSNLEPIFIYSFKIVAPLLKKMILRKNPNLLCFDIYRLGYYCSTNC